MMKTQKFLWFLLVLMALDVTATEKNGFDLSDALIPEDEIRKGGPPRDGIPAIHHPEFLSANEATNLKDRERVLGVVIAGQARAYPIKVLNWHEVINDVVGDQHFVVTYCPLCGTGMVFATNMSETSLVFGVSGLLYNSDVLLYDLQTESLWSQIMSQAVTGPAKGTILPQLPAVHTTWLDWRTNNPGTQVLKIENRSARNYNQNPYSGYDRKKRLYFPVNNTSELDIHPKEKVLGVKVGGVSKAYPFTELMSQSKPRFEDRVGGQMLTIAWNEQTRSAQVTDSAGQDYVSTIAFWFAWYAFNPRTEVFSAVQQ